MPRWTTPFCNFILDPGIYEEVAQLTNIGVLQYSKL
jgi:hypothetical protein